MLTRATLTRFSADTARRPHPLVRFAAACCLPRRWGWACSGSCVVALAAGGIEGTPLLVLSGVGLLVTAALLPVAHRQQVTKLRGLAATDALTGLANHRGFHEVLARGAGARPPRSSARSPW